MEVGDDSAHDAESKAVLLKIIKHRLTDNILWLKTTPAPYRKILDEPNVKLPSLKDLNGDDYVAKDIFYLEQYIIPEAFEAKPDDVIIDGGAYLGETAAFFASLVGPGGKVYSFEGHPRIYEALTINMKNNGIDNVVCVNKVLGQSEGMLRLSDNSFGSFITSDGVFSVDAVSIDGFIEAYGIKKLDLIKLDIEGGEADAILGARETIRKYKPKLALAAYHKKDDFYNLMKLLLDIDSSYEFMMRHTSSRYSETVLFAF